VKLSDPIQYLKGVGERRAALLKKLGVTTPGELLLHFPRAYEDWQTIVPILQAPVDRPCCIRAIVDHAPAEETLRGGLSVFKTTVTDGAGVLAITLFNNPWAAEKLRAGDEFLFYGRVQENFFRREMPSPRILPVVEARLHAVYPLTEGLQNGYLEQLVRRCMEQTLPQVRETLPEELRAVYHLMPLREAVRAIHLPQDLAQAERARNRLIFDELLKMQLELLRLRQEGRQESAFALPRGAGEAFLTSLPFVPTAAQLRVVAEAEADMAAETPMRRLLQGDVGAGKTAVAAALLYAAARAGLQGALLAPTELLARQHYATLQKLFSGLLPPEQCALLVGATPAVEKRSIKAALKKGALPLVVGTHALLQKDVRFASLALAVVDEQHRFGVAQREALESAGQMRQSPHLLVMSATPIPRSLALVLYSDLELSVLDALPPGRVPVKTYCVDASYRARIYAYIRKHLDAGRQGYIVCPRVAEGENGAAPASAENYAAQLRMQEFAAYRVALLHGKMKPKEKEDAMRAFAEGETQLLVATTVVEVGVDVPNATIMIIENAERFGLAQLHQLRGRVGRGAQASDCVLVTDAAIGAQARARLERFTQTQDGFAIARADLEQRGPGEFFGQRQHGLPPFRLADLLRDTQILEQSRAAAQALAQMPLAGEQRKDGAE
jgi:ATP-dependent DNA helicase RecG